MKDFEVKPHICSVFNIAPLQLKVPLVGVELNSGMTRGPVPGYNLPPGKEAELLAALDKRQLDWQRGMVENPNNHLYA